MIWRILSATSAALAALALAGCGQSGNTGINPGPTVSPNSAAPDLGASASTEPAQAPAPTASASSAESRVKAEILNNVMRLLETAAQRPGGANITIATENLNQYFEGTPPTEFALTPESKAFLDTEFAALPAPLTGRFTTPEFETPAFELKDARHIEDCLLNHSIATRVAGNGSTLDRVKRLFDWTVGHVELVPANGLIPPGLVQQGLEQAPARPYDVISRGAATEVPGTPWAERAWVFMALCRQIGVDVALVSHPAAEGKSTVWACAALVDGVPYVFDARIGQPIAGPDGTGVATLEQAVTDPQVLDRLDLPGFSNYLTKAPDLQKPLTVLIDSSRGYLSPRMGRLERDLAGRNRMILHRDPAQQADAFRKAFGERLGAVKLWTLPLEVEYRLFNDPKFVTASQIPNTLFDPKLPLLQARLLQLRGDTDEAIQAFVAFRMRDFVVIDNEKLMLPPEARDALTLHATYFLGLCQLEKFSDLLARVEEQLGQLETMEPGLRRRAAEPLRPLFDQLVRQARQSRFFFENTVKLAPAPQAGNLATLYGWGANANLGRVAERSNELVARLRALAAFDPSMLGRIDTDALIDAAGTLESAIQAYGRTDPTPQGFGNLLRARALVWRDPFASPAAAPKTESATASTSEPKAE